MIVIGDVHGKTDAYWKLLRKYKQSSIQVGDFGFKKQYQWLKNFVDPGRHKIVMGNHDYYPELNCAHSLGNFWHHLGLMTVRGAESIDRSRRIEGLDWFREEEMEYREMRDAVQLYEDWLPRIMITHDCPQAIMAHLFGYTDNSKTRMMFEEMFEIHKPDLWVFGHHHQSIDKVILGTRFICLNELEVFELPDYDLKFFPEIETKV